MRAFAWRALATLGILLIAGTFWPSCRNLEAPPRWQEGRCDPDHPCDEGHVCVPEQPGGLLGRCLSQCGPKRACDKGWRCTGRYQRLGTADTFCRKAVGALGAICADPEQGCSSGLHCFRSRCVKTCRKDGDCSAPAQRCLPVLVHSVVDKERIHLFSACLDTTQAEGKPCKPQGPFCGRGLTCHDQACVRTCTADAECGKGKICDGRLYLGAKRDARAKAGAKPDLRYCRKAARRGASCHPTLDVGCARGLACIRFRCRRVRHVAVGKACAPSEGRLCKQGLLCVDQHCRRPCLKDEDCLPGADQGGAEDPADSVGASGQPAARESSPRKHRRRARRHRSRRHSRHRHRHRKAPKPQKCRQRTFAGQPIKVCL